MVTEFDFLAGYMGVYLAQSLFLRLSSIARSVRAFETAWNVFTNR